MEIKNETRHMEYAGADWIERQLKHTQPGAQMSDLGKNVADLLGELFLGIYHQDRQALKVDWTNPSYIEIVIYGEMSTFDYDHLTRLVFLAHDYAIRVEIQAAAPRYLRLIFSQRTREGDIYRRHPTIEDALTSWRKNHA